MLLGETFCWIIRKRLIHSISFIPWAQNEAEILWISHNYFKNPNSNSDTTNKIFAPTKLHLMNLWQNWSTNLIFNLLYMNAMQQSLHYTKSILSLHYLYQAETVDLDMFLVQNILFLSRLYWRVHWMQTGSTTSKPFPEK